MSQTAKKTAFRKFKNGDVIALFVDDIDPTFGSCDAFMLKEGHLPAEPSLAVELEPASTEESKPLELELSRQGYQLSIV